MAPRKANTSAQPAKKSISKNSGKVAKRPARGYHKYKNGLLNVTPKGLEVDLVKQNQNSPLLRLPPEIRNRIWEYTLGHNTFRVIRARGRKAIFILAPDEPGINVAILRSCRQIYSETALMPIQLNTLAFSSIYHIRGVVGRLKWHQQKQVTTIRFEVPLISCEVYDICCWKGEDILARTFPALNHIEFALYNLPHAGNKVTLENAERSIRKHFEQFLADTSVRMTMKELAEPMPESYYIP